ncbi:hypothetical protein QZH41_008937 [Actinostola sp. cb2023]|nr:hypothetical protein QZH41_008937 [Actinostola sp. cb2023]
MEEDFVAVLKSLCVCVNRDVALLDLFFLDNHSESEIGTLSVFPLLISYLHRDGDVGVWARDAVLLCMALSSVDHRLGNYIIEKTNFCPVLATGLSALFSDLPTSLDIPSEDWYSLERGLWATFPELVAFLTSLEFCNNVIQSSVEALTAVTAYIDLFLRSITDSQLMSVFVKFILTEICDGVPILEYLVSRISQETQLSVVSLGLFYTLLDLNCEDIMYTLVLKYLIPCSHILSSQKRTVREVDFYSKSAVKFLSLIPSCCDLYHQTSKPTSLSSSSESLNKSSGGQVKIDLETSHDLVLYRWVSHD